MSGMHSDGFPDFGRHLFPQVCADRMWRDCRLAVDPRFKGMEKKFGAVYYNFPHAGGNCCPNAIVCG